MKMRTLNSVVSVAIVSVLSGCGPAPAVVTYTGKQGALNVTEDPKSKPPPKNDAPIASPEDFRKAAPAPGPAVTFVPPKIEEARLQNGARILIVERHELPIVAFQVVFDRGADQGSPGLGSFMASMLLQGTKRRTAIAISDELARLGAAYDAWGDYDSIGVGARCLSPKLSEVLTVIGDIVQRPGFDEAEVKRERSKRLTAILQQNDRPATLLSNTMLSTLYPAGHPYATPLIGTEAEVARLTAKDLSAFHLAYIKPDRMTIAIAGDVTKARAIEEMSRVFGAWTGTAQAGKDPVEPPPGPAGAPRVILVDRPGATQSHIAVALPGVARSTKDYEAIIVMNMILGGQFSSRLNLNLREKHAYTYGARSGFDMRRGPGPFSAGAPVVRESTGPAVSEILTEVARVRAEMVSDEELADAKSNVILQLPARFESASDTAGSLAALAVYNLPLDEYANRAAKIRAVTKEDVKRVAEKYLTPERTRLVVVGDAKVVEEQIKKVNYGALEVRRAAAAPTPAAASAPAPTKAK